MVTMAEPTILLEPCKERLQESVVMVFKAMGINRDLLGDKAAILEFIRKSRSRLDEIEIEKKKAVQDCLPSTTKKLKLTVKFNDTKRLFDATDRPESSKQGAKRNKRKESSYSGRLEPKRVKMNPASMPLAPLPPLVPPVIPAELMNEITRLGGENVGLVIRKQLLKTDLSRSHDRLSIPENQAKLFAESLTEQEKAKVCNGISMGVEVLVWVTGEPEPQPWKLQFLRWSMNNTRIFVLRTRWWQLVEAHHFQVGDEIRVWSFRRSNNGGDEKKLCFAINVCRDRRNI